MHKSCAGLGSLPSLAGCAALLALGCTAELGEPSQTSSGAPMQGSAGAPTTAGAASGGQPTTMGPTPTDDNGVFTNPPAFQPAPGMLRRLTRSQFRNAIRDIFGVEVDITKLDPDIGQFPAIGAAKVETSPRGVEQYDTAIEGVVNTVFDDATKRAQLIGCTPSSSATDTCTRTFIQSMGQRAWRRPLEAAELDQLGAVAKTATTELGSAVEGARWATIAIFNSPNFLYRPELGAADAAGKLRFTGYETAGRLSFLVQNSTPDKQLLDAAASGTLASADGIKAAVNRLLDSPDGMGRQSIGEFAQQYMELDRVLEQPKDATLYPDYKAELQAGMVRDMRATWEGVAFDDKASALTLFSTTKATVNADLAKLYGIDATGLTATTFKTVSLPADGARVGILSKAGFLSQFANQMEGSPTLRGKFVREWMMCMSVPPPPKGVNFMLADPPADKPQTKRQRLEAHRSDPTCAGCHGLMDPIGLPLETFDAIGRYRTMDRGLPIDPSGEVNGVAVADARAMGNAMADSKLIANCMVRRFFNYAVGYDERDVDGSVINTLAASFAGSGYQLRDLVVATVTHDAFSAVAPQP